MRAAAGAGARGGTHGGEDGGGYRGRPREMCTDRPHRDPARTRHTALLTYRYVCMSLYMYNVELYSNARHMRYV